MSGEYEFDSEDDDEDWSESVTTPCPECGADVYEEADFCSHCGYFLEESSENQLAGKPAWFLVLGLLGILATILILSGLL